MRKNTNEQRANKEDLPILRPLKKSRTKDEEKKRTESEQRETLKKMEEKSELSGTKRGLH